MGIFKSEKKSKTPTPYQRQKEKMNATPQIRSKEKYHYNKIVSQLRADFEKKEILGHDAKIKTVSIYHKYEVFRKNYPFPQKPVKRCVTLTEAQQYVATHPNTYIFSWT